VGYAYRGFKSHPFRQFLTGQHEWVV